MFHSSSFASLCVPSILLLKTVPSHSEWLIVRGASLITWKIVPYVECKYININISSFL